MYSRVRVAAGNAVGSCWCVVEGLGVPDVLGCEVVEGCVLTIAGNVQPFVRIGIVGLSCPVGCMSVSLTAEVRWAYDKMNPPDFFRAGGLV